MNPQVLWTLLKKTFVRWFEENTFRFGAALAYYTIFAVAPMVLIAVFIAGLVFDQETARAHFSQEIGTLAGQRVGQAIAYVAQQAQDTGTGLVGTLISVVVLLVVTTGVFSELQAALNAMWGVKTKPDAGFLERLKNRFWSFTTLLGIGFLLLVSLVVTTALAALAKVLPVGSDPLMVFFWQVLNWGVSFLLVTLLFAIIYRLLPDAVIEWSDVWLGAVLTAVLFTIGKHLIGLYLGQASWVDAYGAAGSLIVILVWVYYSAQIFLFGAAFTREVADYGEKDLRPTRGAVLQEGEKTGNADPQGGPGGAKEDNEQ